MLDARKTKNPVEGKVTSIIGPGTVIKGDIMSKGAIRIEGAVSGRVQCEDAIVVQESGRLRAELLGRQVIISGEVEGNVSAHERIEISAGGKVVGDICAPRISFSGEIFEGRCTMKAPGQPKAPGASAPQQATAPSSPASDARKPALPEG